MTDLIIHFVNEDSDQDQNLNQDQDQDQDQDPNLDLDNQEIQNLHSQIPNQDLYSTPPNQDNEVQVIPKKPEQLKRVKHYI